MAPGKPADQFGPYRVVRQIGSGGMACIFEAKDTRLGHSVAIKRLHPHVAERPGATERFLREGRAAARVRHPHVVQVFALSAEGDSAYLAMELLEGRDLGAILGREGPLGVQAVLDILLPVIAAVAAAHDAGVIHRDLKPSNVFVSRGPGGRPWPKVVDFGISKVLDVDDAASATTDGILGTAAYMAPEQARAMRAASFQSDQYSLAVILYQCVTGALPFSGSSVYDLFSAIMTAPVTPPGQRVDGIPAAFDAIVLRAMSRNPADRFPSVRALGAALLPLAHPLAQAAWSTELHPSVDPPTAIGVDPTGPPADAAAGDIAALPTMSPTARDTRAMRARRRVTRRALWGVLASVVVIAGVAAWTVDRRGVTPGGYSTATTGAAPKDPEDVASAPPPVPETRPADARLLASTDGTDGALPTPPEPTAPTAGANPARRKPVPTRRVVAVIGSASPSASPPSAPPAFGDNGAPILP
jgi:hypothetical protein